MWRYVERNVKWDAMRDVAWCITVVRFEIWYSGIACVLREVLVRYEICDMVRNDGVTWNVVWFGI